MKKCSPGVFQFQAQYMIKSIQIQWGSPTIFQGHVQQITELTKSSKVVRVFFKSKSNDFFKLNCKIS